MKTCTKCKLSKLLEKFSPSKKAKDRLSSWCKNCNNLAWKIYFKKYPWKKTFQVIKTRCNNPKATKYKNYGGRGIKCLITEKELKILWFRDKAYELTKPSIDRINNDKNYTLNNCKYIELSKNIAKQNKTKQEKPINQYDLEGKFIKTWKSGHEIKRVLGFDNRNISNACLGKLKTAYKYIWRFKL